MHKETEQRRLEALNRLRQSGQLAPGDEDFRHDRAYDPKRNGQGWRPVPGVSAPNVVAPPRLSWWRRLQRWVRAFWYLGQYHHDYATALTQMRAELGALERKVDTEVSSEINMIVTRVNAALAKLSS